MRRGAFVKRKGHGPFHAYGTTVQRPRNGGAQLSYCHARTRKGRFCIVGRAKWKRRNAIGEQGCHAMLHREDPPLYPDDLREIINKQRRLIQNGEI